MKDELLSQVAFLVRNGAKVYMGGNAEFGAEQTWHITIEHRIEDVAVTIKKRGSSLTTCLSDALTDYAKVTSSGMPKAAGMLLEYQRPHDSSEWSEESI